MGPDILITGGSGFVGSRLIVALLDRGHRVRALVRPASASRIPSGALAIGGDALDPDAVSDALRGASTLIHLVGTPHPSPFKVEEFERVDLTSVRVSVTAARRTGVAHFIYVSVAQPAPVMKAYLAVRAQSERLIRDAQLTATVLRPWYVLGPGHQWPLLLTPVYALASAVPALRDGARRLGLVTLRQMVDALVKATEGPPAKGTIRIVEVPEIRSLG